MKLCLALIFSLFCDVQCTPYYSNNRCVDVQGVRSGLVFTNILILRIYLFLEFSRIMGNFLRIRKILRIRAFKLDHFFLSFFVSKIWADIH